MATATTPPPTRPILKYVGGKTALLPQLLRRLPRSFASYHEPFMGGGALFFRLHGAGCPSAVLSDANGDLIATYRVVASQPMGIVDELAQFQKRHWRSPAKTFEWVRTEWNASRWTPIRTQGYWAALFIYLNRTCFNGLYRVNKAGHFNVPLGRYKKPKICDPDAILAASHALAKATLFERSFRFACNDVQEDDFVYFDPPYHPVSKTASFRSYTGQGFTELDQRDLAFFAGELVDKGAKVMLSNSDTPLIRKLYKGKRWRIDRVLAPRSINSDAKKRGKVAEVIVTGGYRRHW
jgi:DNA adenine methylase